MAFATRVFCKNEPGPTIGDLLMWLRQQDLPVEIAGGASRGDLVSPWWTEVLLAYDPAEPPFRVRCLRNGNPAEAAALRAEARDFLDDLAELPEGPARERVRAHIEAARFVVVVEFPPTGVVQRGYATNGWLMGLFVERAGGMVQCDGIGFYDEDDEIILRMG